MSTSSYTRVAPVQSQDENNAIQPMHVVLTQQTAQLSRWSTVAKKIISEACSFREGELQDEVTSEDLAIVLDYIRIMKSSIEMYQNLNEALTNRVDELLEISRQDGQYLGTIINQFQTIPGMNIVSVTRDDQNNNVVLNVQINGGPANDQVDSLGLTDSMMLIGQTMVDEEGSSDDLDHDEGKTLLVQPQDQGPRRSWTERGLSLLLCACITGVLAKTKIFKPRCC